MASTDLNRVTVRKAARLLEDTQELHPLIFLNMVVCLNNQDLNQPDRWLTSSLQASFLVSKADMVDHLPSLLANTLTSKWDMEVLLALVAMAVVPSRPPMLNGVPQLVKPLGTASVATRDKQHTHLTTRPNFPCNVFALSIWHGLSGMRDINSGVQFLTFCVCFMLR